MVQGERRGTRREVQFREGVCDIGKEEWYRKEVQ